MLINEDRLKSLDNSLLEDESKEKKPIIKERNFSMNNLLEDKEESSEKKLNEMEIEVVDMDNNDEASLEPSDDVEVEPTETEEEVEVTLEAIEEKLSELQDMIASYKSKDEVAIEDEPIETAEDITSVED